MHILSLILPYFSAPFRSKQMRIDLFSTSFLTTSADGKLLVLNINIPILGFLFDNLRIA